MMTFCIIFMFLKSLLTNHPFLILSYERERERERERKWKSLSIRDKREKVGKKTHQWEREVGW